MRWIWIDRFTEFRRGEFARAVKQLSFAEDVFAAHFPDYPVMPATLLLEGLAQTGGILVGDARDFREKVVLAKIGKAKFCGEALAGDEVAFEATVLCAEMTLLLVVTVQSEKPLQPTRMTVPVVFVSVVLLETTNVPDEREPELPPSTAMAMASVPIRLPVLLPEIELPVMVMLPTVPAGPPPVLALPPMT